MKRILMTGAAGGVAALIRPLLLEHYELVLSDQNPITTMQPGESFMDADLADLTACEQLCEGIDGIIHLGGFSVEGPWEVIHQSNIVGCYNIFEAARRQRVSHLVFASSNHAMGFYRRSEIVSTDRRVRPDGLYGVSKAYGEAMGSLYADKFGMSVLSIRIGNVGPVPVDARRLAIWIHQEDLVQLCRIGLEHPDLHCEVVYGASENKRSWWDNQVAYNLGYAPKHRSEGHVQSALEAQAKIPADEIGDLFQGGQFCSIDFAGDPGKI